MICLENLNVRNRKWAVVWCGKHRQTPGQKYFSPHFPDKRQVLTGNTIPGKMMLAHRSSSLSATGHLYIPAASELQRLLRCSSKSLIATPPENHVCFLSPSVSPFHYFLSSFRVLFSQGNAFYFQKPNWIFFSTASTDTAEWQQIESGHRVASWG